jgi:secondary thiamine-phosphate synthase enzyme
MTWQGEISLQTTGHRDIHDITREVQRLVSESRIATGVVNVSVIGSTAAVGGIEMEPGLAGDLPEALDRILPPSRSYGHERAWHDGNGHSHLQAALLGQSMSVPVSEGKPALGTWQQMFLLECDVKPRRRTVVVTVMGD